MVKVGNFTARETKKGVREAEEMSASILEGRAREDLPFEYTK